MQDSTSFQAAWLKVLRRLPARSRAVVACTCKAARIAAKAVDALDASRGHETLPVLIDGSLEEAERLRDSVQYVTGSFVSGERTALRSVGGCADVCRGACSRETCPCSRAPDGEPAFDAHGRLRSAAADFPLTECGQACSCGEACPNKVTQRQVAVPLTIILSGQSGWGVVTDARLARGTFVAVYAGEVRQNP